MSAITSKNKGSSFKELVYGIVKKIPRGTTMTYKEVAKAIGRPRSYRAVGNVLNKNYDKKIPCHRVIRSDGTMGGYNRGKSNKVAILRREGVKT
jgi:methylated-DNA-[protein]-cysteine S-methyltransferase